MATFNYNLQQFIYSVAVAALMLLATAAADAGAAADFVVVGGGTAGCVVAARICRDLPDASVLLLERGKPRGREDNLLVRSPVRYQETWTIPDLTETWQSEPNPGLRGRTLPLQTGNTLGGSSAVNTAQWVKPPLATFDGDAWGFSGAAPRQCACLTSLHV